MHRATTMTHQLQIKHDEQGLFRLSRLEEGTSKVEALVRGWPIELLDDENINNVANKEKTLEMGGVLTRSGCCPFNFPARLVLRI